MSKRPSHHLWAVRKTDDGKGYWTVLGAAWMHEDGEGMSLKFDLWPVAGQDIVIRRVKPKSAVDQSDRDFPE
jgi:hypothetical protein